MNVHVRLAGAVLLAALAGCRTTPKLEPLPESGKIVLEGAYSGHLQDVCRSGNCIYWMHTRTLLKTDFSGKVLARKEMPDHHAGCEVRDGKLYVAVCAMQSKTGGKTLSGSRVQINVFDADTLELLEEHVTDINDRSGSFCFLEDGTCLVGCLRHPELKPDQVRFHHLDKNFKLIKSYVLDNVTVKLGIEVIKRKGDFYYLFLYKGKGLALKLDKNFNEVARFTDMPGNVGIFQDGDDWWVARTKCSAEVDKTKRTWTSFIERQPDFDVSAK